MQPLVFTDPLDHDRTPGQIETVTAYDGSESAIWVRPKGPTADQPSPTFRRADFVPPAPLLRVPRTARTLATEELAARVMDAGIEDLAFQDVEGEGVPGDARYWQL